MTDDWIKPADAARMLEAAGVEPENARKLLYEAAAAGSLTAKADRLTRDLGQMLQDMQQDYVVERIFWNGWKMPDGFHGDWTIGTFNTTVHGLRWFAEGVKFNGAGVAEILSRASPAPKQAVAGASTPTTSPGRQRGRPPNAEAWKEFAIELACHIHDTGPPDGTGHTGQEELISTICDKLTERGIEPMSRSSLQPVVREVLRRIRPDD